MYGALCAHKKLWTLRVVIENKNKIPQFLTLLKTPSHKILIFARIKNFISHTLSFVNTFFPLFLSFYIIFFPFYDDVVDKTFGHTLAGEQHVLAVLTTAQLRNGNWNRSISLLINCLTTLEVEW